MLFPKLPSQDLEKSSEKIDSKEESPDNYIHRSKRNDKNSLHFSCSFILAASLYLCLTLRCPSLGGWSYHATQDVQFGSFYHNITRPRFPCAMRDGVPTSFAGTIGLKGDTEETPKRSFFWYFEAEDSPQDAPIVLTIGGGPGSSGLLNGLSGQSSCLVTAPSTIEHNPNRWTKHFNVIMLDHPTNAGYSYGTKVNNSHDAAVDVYDFLQKFFKLFPHLQKNKLALASGSYGGVYIPNIAYVIYENNKAIVNKTMHSDKNLLINLDSIMLSNPVSNPLVYFEWVPEYRCIMHQVYNSTTCNALYSNLPKCLESIRLAYQYSNVHYRTSAMETCYKYIKDATTDVLMEDIRQTCEPTEDPKACHPFMNWVETFFKNESTKDILGIARDRQYMALNIDIFADFWAYGDLMQPHHELFIPLINDGIRVLHYIGAQDANCPWPGTLSTLKQLQSPYQDAFLSTQDVLWDSGLNQTVTIRQVGKGAGDFTYILIDQVGHFVTHDQPKLARTIADHWIRNIPFTNVSDANIT